MSNTIEDQDTSVDVFNVINGYRFRTVVDGVSCTLHLGDNLKAKPVSFHWQGDCQTSIATVNAVACERFAQTLKEFDVVSLETIGSLQKLL